MSFIKETIRRWDELSLHEKINYRTEKCTPAYNNDVFKEEGRFNYPLFGQNIGTLYRFLFHTHTKIKCQFSDDIEFIADALEADERGLEFYRKIYTDDSIWGEFEVEEINLSDDYEVAQLWFAMVYHKPSNLWFFYPLLTEVEEIIKERKEREEVKDGILRSIR